MLEPPYFSETKHPSSPRSAILRVSSTENSSLSSSFRAIGAICFSAKDRIAWRVRFCSSLKSKSMVHKPMPELFLVMGPPTSPTQRLQGLFLHAISADVEQWARGLFRYYRM